MITPKRAKWLNLEYITPFCQQLCQLNNGYEVRDGGRAINWLEWIERECVRINNDPARKAYVVFKKNSKSNVYRYALAVNRDYDKIDEKRLEYQN